MALEKRRRDTQRLPGERIESREVAVLLCDPDFNTQQSYEDHGNIGS